MHFIQDTSAHAAGIVLTFSWDFFPFFSLSLSRRMPHQRVVLGYKSREISFQDVNTALRAQLLPCTYPPPSPPHSSLQSINFFILLVCSKLRFVLIFLVVSNRKALCAVSSWKAMKAPSHILLLLSEDQGCPCVVSGNKKRLTRTFYAFMFDHAWSSLLVECFIANVLILLARKKKHLPFLLNSRGESNLTFQDLSWFYLYRILPLL
jgi:hypothetical protein